MHVPACALLWYALLHVQRLSIANPKCWAPKRLFCMAPGLLTNHTP